MNNKTRILKKSGNFLEKQYMPAGSSDDNDILELQKKTLQLIPTQLITKDNNKIQSGSRPVWLSSEVEEEKCDTDNGNQNGTNSSVQEAHGTHIIKTNKKQPEKLLSKKDVKEYYIRKRIMQEQRKTNNYTTVKQCIITPETIMRAIEEQSKENTEGNDKVLDIICKNLHGEFKNITLPFYDEEINKIMKAWRRWHKISPWFRSTPLMYKCYVCHKGWWRMHPFKEHLKEVHSNPHLKLRSECITDEFSIITTITKDFNVKDVEMDSYCWKCGRDATFHKRTYLKPAQYECSGCNKYMATCTILKQHESTCSKYIGLQLKKYNVESNVKCAVCLIFCINKHALDAHMIDYHLVRSDEPIILESKVCHLCNHRYIVSTFHDCPAKPKRYKCKHCGRTFSSQTFLDIHMEYSRGSSVSQCVVLDHYMKNTKNYCLMYMCSKCDINVLLKNETIYGTHGMIHNNRFPSRLILLPIKCLSDEFVTSEKTFKIKDEQLIGFLAGIVHLKDIEALSVDMKTIYPSEKIQPSTKPIASPNTPTGLIDGDVINLDDDDDVINSDKDDDVINLDEDDDVMSSIESGLKPENFGDNDSDIKAMQAQLDEEIMRDLEMEATISKVFEASKGYQLLMEMESSEKMSKRDQLLKKPSKTRQLMEKESKKGEKVSVNRELRSEESIQKQSMKIEEDGWKYEDDLKIPDVGVEDVNTNKSDINLEAKDIMVISRNLSDSKQNQNYDTPTIVKEESLIYEDTIKVEPEVFIQQKVKLEPSEHLTKKLYEDMVQIIAFNQSLKEDMDDVNMESGVQLHECEECDYTGRWSQYIEHVSTECPGTEFSCNLCTKSIRYRNLNHYLQHLTEHDYLPLSCPECQVQHKFQDDLHTHVISHIQALFSGTKSMKVHYVTSYYCNKCGLSVQSKHFLKHWQTCVNEKNSDSSEEDNSPECRSVSMSSKHIREAKSECCQFCSQTFFVLDEQ